MSSEVTLSCTPSLNALLPKGNTDEIEAKLSLPEELEAPVESGTKIGTLTYYHEGATVDEVEIITSSESKKMSFGEIYKVLWNNVFSL